MKTELSSIELRQLADNFLDSYGITNEGLRWNLLHMLWEARNDPENMSAFLKRVWPGFVTPGMADGTNTFLDGKWGKLPTKESVGV